jgi:hypothetical protein
MFKVRSYNKKDKKLKEHEVKALGIIWAKLPQVGLIIAHTILVSYPSNNCCAVQCEEHRARG